ncbi:unnamed protein product [Caenorhabditis bovis]|uniref:Uncharacterized protein n=1 Tax=Caenorhabditis bovis TaxID=2654633 RepID=A0A8S1F4V4_9PELO|nr:unnamed protein product [Caenorhabditis bovis]
MSEEEAVKLLEKTANSIARNNLANMGEFLENATLEALMDKTQDHLMNVLKNEKRMLEERTKLNDMVQKLTGLQKEAENTVKRDLAELDLLEEQKKKIEEDIARREKALEYIDKSVYEVEMARLKQLELSAEKNSKNRREDPEGWLNTDICKDQWLFADGVVAFQSIEAVNECPNGFYHIRTTMGKYCCHIGFPYHRYRERYSIANRTKRETNEKDSKVSDEGRMKKKLKDPKIMDYSKIMLGAVIGQVIVLIWSVQASPMSDLQSVGASQIMPI